MNRREIWVAGTLFRYCVSTYIELLILLNAALRLAGLR